jgi:site-specific recombinase XerD
MSYRTYIRTVLKNLNEKNIGSVNLEIAFTHHETKRKIRRYVNLEQYIHKNDFGRKGIKTHNRTSLRSLAYLIEKKKQELADTLRNLEIQYGEITPEIYDQSLKVSSDVKKDIFELLDMFIAYKKKTVDSRTVKKYNSLKTALEEYVEQSKFKNIYTSDITVAFLNEFTAYLTDERDLGVDTINKYQSCFNSFMDYLTNDLKINKNLAYREFKKTSRNRSSESKVVLLKEHVEKIINWIPEDERWEKVKDLFMFQIYEGIRFSDLERINRSFVKNDNLSFVMYKTKTRVTVPLHKNAKQILQKYDYNLGGICKALKNYNLDLKSMCRKAGLTEPVSQLKIKINAKIPQSTELCELVSSHVGRTTFVTNCLVSGISPFIVMSFTGHTKVETLNFYMKIAGDMTQDAYKKFEQYFDFK